MYSFPFIGDNKCAVDAEVGQIKLPMQLWKVERIAAVSPEIMPSVRIATILATYSEHPYSSKILRPNRRIRNFINATQFHKYMNYQLLRLLK